MDKELKDCTAEELEARLDQLAGWSDVLTDLASWGMLEWDGDTLRDWSNIVAIEEELGKR